MKIGINASFLRKPYTGIGQYTFYLLEALFQLPQAQDHQFFLYFEEQKSLQKIARNPVFTRKNVIKKVIKTPFYKRDDLVRKTAWERINLPSAAKKDKLEIFFSPYNAATSFPLTKHVITIHDIIWKVYEKEYINNFRKSIYSKQTFEAIKRASRLITVSEYSKKEINKYLEIDLGFITVVKNGVADYFKPLNNQKQISKNLKKLGIDFPYLFYMGGFEKRKNVDLLLSAFQKIVGNYPNVLEDRKLVIAGELWKHSDPLVTDVKKIISRNNLLEKVVLLGPVEDKDRAVLYNGADLFVYPSFYEGFGMTILEAMACGCPVLSSNRTALPEVGQDAVVYFNPDREDELIQQINRLLTNPDILQSLAQKGPARAQNFSWEKAAGATLKILRETALET